MSPDPTDRATDLERLSHPFDLLVVGGGVNGLAVAWDAALSGLTVAVVDKGDWGSGTSSWSSRMVHGGLKYLERYDVRLVRESLADREWLLRRAPHLVRPLPFVLPSFAGDAHRRVAVRAGMLAYDALSLRKSVPRHRNLDRADVARELPGLRRAGLLGASRYYDAQVEYAERLCVELMLGARAAGATTLNYMELEHLLQDGHRVVGGRVTDRMTGTGYDVAATLIVNVAGPWIDDVLAGTPAASKRWIGGTKGTHLIVDPFPGAPQQDAMYYESDDGRPMMVIPWLGRYLIGSTDKRFTGDLDTVGADQEELDYILRATNKVFPDAGLTRAAIRYWYTGVRPLPYTSDGKTADISRRHEIIDHAPGIEGLVSVVGGKLTTFCGLAEDVHRAVNRRLPAGRSLLREQTLPGALEPSPEGRLGRIYGCRAQHVIDLVRTEPDTAAVLDEPTGLIAAEVVHVVRHEQAVHLADVLARRVMVGLEPDLGRTAAPGVAAVMARELGWTDERTAAELAGYEQYLRRFEVLQEERADAAAARN